MPKNARYHSDFMHRLALLLRGSTDTDITVSSKEEKLPTAELTISQADPPPHCPDPLPLHLAPDRHSELDALRLLCLTIDTDVTGGLAAPEETCAGSLGETMHLVVERLTAGGEP